MSLIKTLITTIAVALLAGGLIGWFVIAPLLNPPQEDRAGAINQNSRRGQSNVYTLAYASSGQYKALSTRGNRCGLEAEVTDSTSSVRLYLQNEKGSEATSTIARNTGFLLDPKGSYTPEFIWPGEAWIITDQAEATTATSSIVFQETICN